jgi:hypothetical protein
MEAKRKRSRLGTVAVVLGVVLLGLGIYGFARGGAELLGIWGVGFGVGALAVGIVLLKKAAAAR